MKVKSTGESKQQLANTISGSAVGVHRFCETYFSLHVVILSNVHLPHRQQAKS